MHGDEEDRVNDRIEAIGAAGETTPEPNGVVGVDMVHLPVISGNQLTLSFQGELYVFDSIEPERVQAVLLLLGGQELPSDSSAVMVSTQLNRREGGNDVAQTPNSHRLEAIMRYRQKKKNLCFDKKVTYEVRSEVASRMKRHRGQFASSKSNPEEGARFPGGDSAQSNLQEEVPFTKCQNCGTGKDETPMMRRGPDGPKSLCNACGLMWASKKTLGNKRHRQTFELSNRNISPNEQREGSDSDILGNEQMATENSDGHPSMVTAEIGHATEF